MPPLLLLFTVYFLLTSFLSGVPDLDNNNPILSYFYLHGKLIIENWLIYSVLVLGLFLFLFISKRKAFSFIKLIRIFFTYTIISSLISLLILIIISIVQLNITALLLNLDSGLSGVENDAEVISESLKDKSAPPEFIVGNEEDGSLLTAVAEAQSGKNTFYGGRIVKNIPSFLSLPVKKKGSGALVVGNTLIISRVSSDDFQKISPVVSYLFIKNYFPEKEIKKYPKVYLMDKDVYGNFRQEDFETKAQVLGELVIEIEEKSSDLSSQISQKEQRLFDIEETIQLQKTERENQYNQCMNEGYYDESEYIKTNSRESCREQIAALDEQISELSEEQKELDKELQNDRATLQQYEDYINFYNSQKRLTEQSTGFISFEFASFKPPDEISVALSDKTDPQTVADYFAILVHEYLHYTTFDEGGASLATGFFTEGLTEYFARKIIKSNLGIETNVSYPINVKIITQMGKRISDSDLSEIYFSNDESKLSELLDRVYGEGFYSRNLVLLETLHYTSNVENVLDIGNRIMQEIGGEPLTEKDTKTTYSTFE